MVESISSFTMEDSLFAEAVKAYREAKHPVSITGAGISVESGIPDFRSPGGLWSVFDPQEYATIDAFIDTPEKAWKLYRAIAEKLREAKPNPAHEALARLEAAGHLAAIVTQNIDNLHQDAGSKSVIEVHGDHGHLQCLKCNTVEPAEESQWFAEKPAACGKCGSIMKPNVVLFGEGVRRMAEIQKHLELCDALLVVGTSAQVHPVASFPALVKARGGQVYEFNIEETALTHGGSGLFGIFSGFSTGPITDYFLKGSASESLDAFASAVIGK